MIGVFDSGVGGLSVVKQLLKAFNSDIIYLGDTARLPYGTKSKETVLKYSIQNAEFLMRFNVDAIVVACNTASSVAIDVLKKKFNLPVFGVIEPAAKLAAKFEKVCVIGTTSTIQSNAYPKKIAKYNKGCRVTQRACPLFVPLVEEGWIYDDITYEVAKRYLYDLECDALILGCTHYPLLREIIQRVMGVGVSLIDSGEALVKGLKDFKDLFEGSGRLNCYTTDSEEKFAKLGSMFLGKQFNGVKLVDLG
ncbi:glutamate racemase [Hippea maritima]|uniref:glutamate racemase n=1 Tax=Hippea maritima TaxID=84405 RepID=UPI001C54D99E|nr:glutamate racemase [Hippea maritima]